jgi:hypothetical protein
MEQISLQKTSFSLEAWIFSYEYMNRGHTFYAQHYKLIKNYSIKVIFKYHL